MIETGLSLYVYVWLVNSHSISVCLSSWKLLLQKFSISYFRRLWFKAGVPNQCSLYENCTLSKCLFCCARNACSCATMHTQKQWSVPMF